MSLVDRIISKVSKRVIDEDRLEHKKRVAAERVSLINFLTLAREAYQEYPTLETKRLYQKASDGLSGFNPDAIGRRRWLEVTKRFRVPLPPQRP